MSVSIGCVIVGICSYIISFFGFRAVQTFEKYAWIVSFVLIAVLLGQASPHIAMSGAGLQGATLAGTWLSFMAVCFSSGSAWASIAADYYCHYKANTEGWLVFLLTFLGLSIPTIFIYGVGACIGEVALFSGDEPSYNAYVEHGLGGLIREVYHPLGWGKFSMVMLTFSVLGNNIVVFYSSGLSLQLLGHHFHAIPQYIWSFYAAVVVTVLAIAGQENLSNIMFNFVSLLGVGPFHTL